MDAKDKVSVWAGIITLAVLQANQIFDTELNLYNSGWADSIGSVVGYAIGFVILYFVVKWLLERYYKGKSQPQPTPPPPFGSP